MLLDFEVQRCSRRCAATERQLAPGETYYSLLEVHGAEILRKDYCSEAWQGPPEHALGWWKARVPEPSANKIKLAPNDVLLELFDHLADQPTNQDMRYVLALLLVRRRVFRTEPSPVARAADSLSMNGNGSSNVETMLVHCPRRDASYEVPAVMPDEQRIQEIQDRLSDLLIADAE